jgi:cyanobactin maturation PatA/PatG family protease
MPERVKSQSEATNSGASRIPQQLELEPLWAESTGDSRICVAVLDGPVDTSHPCFKGANISVLETLIPNLVDDGLASMHGTHVASVLFGQHSGAVRGVAPGCRGLIIPVFNSGVSKSENGALSSVRPCSQLDLARAITQAVASGANIINISGGQLDPSGQAHPLLADAVRMCADNGVLIVAAAGNDGCDCLHIPAGEPSVLVVGAMDSKGSPMDFSNWGRSYAGRGILAPGENILGAVPRGDTAARTGTSFATPIVSGAVALLLSIQIKRGQKPDAKAACRAILDSAIGCSSQPVPDCSRLLAGRLNAAGALAYLNKGGNVEMSERLDEVNDASNSEGTVPRWAPGVEPTAVQFQPSLSVATAVQAAPASVQAARSGAGMIPAEVSAGARIDQSQPSAPPQHSPEGILPSCGCGGGGGGCSCGTKARPALVYVLGEIGYDFGTEARRDSYLQHSGKNLLDPHQLLEHLGRNPADAAGIIWTLNVDATPIYALQPAGGFAAFVYDRIREFLAAQLNEGADRVSVPGYATGSVRLLNGQTVPYIIPEVRGMYSWSTYALINSLHGESGEKPEESHNQKEEDVRNFLERVYYEIRNLGVAPQERAINYAATNAFQIESVYRDAITQNLKLDTIEVERSPICRPESDCWDVKLSFFNPHKRMEEARNVYRFTVDVSDVVPVTVGKVRSWRVF